MYAMAHSEVKRCKRCHDPPGCFYFYFLSLSFKKSFLHLLVLLPRIKFVCNLLLLLLRMKPRLLELPRCSVGVGQSVYLPLYVGQLLRRNCILSRTILLLTTHG